MEGPRWFREQVQRGRAHGESRLLHPRCPLLGCGCSLRTRGQVPLLSSFQPLCHFAEELGSTPDRRSCLPARKRGLASPWPRGWAMGPTDHCPHGVPSCHPPHCLPDLPQAPDSRSTVQSAPSSCQSLQVRRRVRVSAQRLRHLEGRRRGHVGAHLRQARADARLRIPHPCSVPREREQIQPN